MEGYRKQFISLHQTSHNGPLVLLDGQPTEDDLVLAARIAARFGQGKNEPEVEVEITFPDGSSKLLHVEPLAPGKVEEAWYV